MARVVFFYLLCLLFKAVRASNSTQFCSAINMYGYYPLYISESCAAAGSPVGTATSHRCSGTSCDASTFESPCSDGHYTPKEQCLQGYCRITWESTCQENRVVKQTYWSVGTCSVSGYDSINGGTQSICESRGGTWTWPVTPQACRDAAAKHHYIYFATCATCNDNYKCLVSNTGIAGYQINGWQACNVFAPTSCSDCSSYTTPETCNAQPSRRWTTSFTYDSSKEIMTFWYPDGLITGESIWYGNFDPEGIKGDRGDVGPQGPAGVDGEKGEKGDRGDKGERGYNGTKGDRGESIFHGNYDPALAQVYSYEIGQVVAFNGELFHLTDRLHQGEPKTNDGSGWITLKGDQGERADPLYRGNFDQNIADQLAYKLSDIVMMSDGALYQLVSVLNQNDPVAGAPDSSGWMEMRGQRGEQGEQGIQGERGDPGPAGGPKGDKGDDGLDGAQGPKGDKGDTGPSIFKGTYDSSIAAVLGYEVGDIVLMSNGEFYALNNKLNQNDPVAGEADSEGWRPIRGPEGQKGQALFRGSYDPAESYSDGDVVRSSANGMLYQLVGTDNGYPELESSNWVVLSGPKGDRGEAGRNGTDGARGATGAQGERGERGQRGFNGTRGEQGIQGERGERGFNGTDGARGATGAQGEKGDTGETGRSNFRGIYNINSNSEYVRGDIVEYNDLLYALIEAESGGLPGSDSSWLSLQGMTIIPEDNSIGLGWIILIAVVAALLIVTIFFLVYYFFFVNRPMATRGRIDIPPVKAMAVEGDYYYQMQ